MAFCVDDQVIALAANGRQEADIGLIPCRKQDRGLTAKKIGDLAFKILVRPVTAIRDAGTGCAGAVFGQCRDGRRDGAVIEGQDQDNCWNPSGYSGGR